jgi:hypothetical protein
MRRIIGIIGATLAIVAFTAMVAGSAPGDSKTQASVPCDPCGMDGGTGSELLLDADWEDDWFDDYLSDDWFRAYDSLAWFEDYGMGDQLDPDLTAEVDVSGDKAVLVTAEPVGGSPMPTSDPVLAAKLT